MKAKVWQVLAVVVVGVSLSASLYLGLVAWMGGTLGFPLDDAWIHQTYARNLAEDGQWSYEAGRASTGSTSPLWTLALTPAYMLGIDYRLWTYVLGALSLAWLAWLAWRVVARLFGDSSPVRLFAASICVLEWHLVWAAFSGMEALLFAALVLACLDLYLAFESRVVETRHVASLQLSLSLEWLTGLGMGVCAALLVLTRPEGLALLALIALSFVIARLRRGVTQREVVWGATSVFVCLAFLVSYAAFNLRMAGFIFPTTFYAKQAEYRTMVESMSLPARFGQLLLTIWTGPQLLLVPGFVFSVFSSLRRRRLDMILLWAWWLCSVGVYALRLPVTYQHGRYLIPTIPVFVILGVWGTWEVVRSLGSARMGWVLSRAWLVTVVVLLLLFWVLGARAYAHDVNFIYGEMGAMAAWLDENVSPQARLAVHDIGMVGYHLRRPFLDLAGLVTPEVIPFIDDEERLLDFMQARGVDYVVVFPDWSAAYRRMVRDPRLTLVYSTHYSWTLSAGQQNLSAYRADWSLAEP